MNTEAESFSQSYSPTYHITLYNDAQHELEEF